MVVAAVSFKLRVKYGLQQDPTSIQVDAWTQLTDSYIRQGTPPEQAGQKAAKLLFADFGTKFYASEADDIVALLNAAKRRQ